MQVTTKRLWLTAAAALLIVMTMSQSAFAAGWWKENNNDTINVLAGTATSTADSILWSSASSNPRPTAADDSTLYQYNTPHAGFSTASNRCKTCHAVHGARDVSYRLLRDASRTQECNYCHMGPAGASALRLYALDDLGYSVQGEHTLGSTLVPDSNIQGGTNGNGNLPDRGGPYDPDTNKQGLYCYSCHSVHGANIVRGVGRWEEKILRNDPAMNGGNADNGLQDGIAGRIFKREDGATIDMSLVMRDPEDPLYRDWTEGPSNGYARDAEVKKAFCADCHTKNYNFRVNINEFDDGSDLFGNGPETPGQDYSLNKQAHPMNDNGELDMGGGAGNSGYKQVSSTGFFVEWCGSCHTAADAASQKEITIKSPNTGGDPWGQTWRVVGFPHQGTTPKFFRPGYDTGGNDRDATQTNDAYEAIPRMDSQICQQCHASGGGGWGVGETTGF